MGVYFCCMMYVVYVMLCLCYVICTFAFLLRENDEGGCFFLLRFWGLVVRMYMFIFCGCVCQNMISMSFCVVFGYGSFAWLFGHSKKFSLVTCYCYLSICLL